MVCSSIYQEDGARCTRRRNWECRGRPPAPPGTACKVSAPLHLLQSSGTGSSLLDIFLDCRGFVCDAALEAECGPASRVMCGMALLTQALERRKEET